MSGILRTDTIQNSNTSNLINQTNATTITIGESGQTVALASGASSSGFGATYNGAVNWSSTIQTSGFTAVSGTGYFCNTTSAAFTVTLPASPSSGSIVAIADYANTFATNNITVGRNGSNIAGSAINSILSTNGISVTFVYVDATQGWIITDSGNRSESPQPTFITATGGTITTCGCYKIHTFTGSGTFTVCSIGNPSGGPNTVDYLVVAGGAGSGNYYGAGGGAGGYREGKSSPAPSYTASPIVAPAGITVTATAYPITVGAGGAGTPGAVCSTNVGGSGGNSIFSTITSAGGGGGSGGSNLVPSTPGAAGGSGGGAGGYYNVSGGAGNTPPVSPSQGFPGGSNSGPSPNSQQAGGGGAGAAAANTTWPGPNPLRGSAGGDGVGTGINPSPSYGTPGPSAPLRYFAGGGAGVNNGGGVGGGGSGSCYQTPGAAGTPGTVNTGGGGGTESKNGGSGIIMIRYKYK